MVDKIAFTEYCQLPGIISDRFHQICSGERRDGRVCQENFVNLMLSVFAGDFQHKMMITFRM